jgi:TPP-dependent pyruvate/acetoin dehydrogenase alpha subunit
LNLSPSIKSGETTGKNWPAKLVSMHKDLLRIRHTEETIARRYTEQEMRTPVHLGIGQEAVAVGVCSALDKGDVVYSHHRSHNHYLAAGGSVYELAAELYGRQTGCARGRGGSVHLTSLDTGFIISTAILGETVACAVGSALAIKMDGKDRAAVTFFGDAACEEGIVYESFNYASVNRLPVLFVCENNLYSTESPLSVRQAPGTELTERARAFKIHAEKADGNDVLAVYEAAQRSIARCRSGQGPVFIELMTYRWREHVGPKFDYEFGRTYRTRLELETWMERCPVKLSGARLIEKSIASQQELDRWAAETQAAIDADFDKARIDPWPSPEDLFENVI